MQQDIEHCKQMVYATAAREVDFHETRAFVVWASPPYNDSPEVAAYFHLVLFPTFRTHSWLLSNLASYSYLNFGHVSSIDAGVLLLSESSCSLLGKGWFF